MNAPLRGPHPISQGLGAVRSILQPLGRIHAQALLLEGLVLQSVGLGLLVGGIRAVRHETATVRNTIPPNIHELGRTRWRPE